VNLAFEVSGKVTGVLVDEGDFISAGTLVARLENDELSKQREQALANLKPVRYFLEIARGIFLKGAGIQILWPQMTALFIFGTAMILLSALRFQKRLD